MIFTEHLLVITTGHSVMSGLAITRFIINYLRCDLLNRDIFNLLTEIQELAEKRLWLCNNEHSNMG